MVLVDPDMFVTGSDEEIKSFIFLTAVIPFAHCFHHRYNINTEEAAKYASDFISAIEGKMHSLSFKETNMSSEMFKTVIAKVTFPNLLKLDLSGNLFDDGVFDALNRLVKSGARRLSYLNLSRNMINLGKYPISYLVLNCLWAC